MPRSSVSVAILFLLMSCAGFMHAHELQTEFRVLFRVNSTEIDTAYNGNAARMREMTAMLRDIRRDSATEIVDVLLCGAASPEGGDLLNRRLARGRLDALEKVVRAEIDIPDSVITRADSYIPWRDLRSLVEESDLKCKDEVISILEEKSGPEVCRSGERADSRIVKLKQLDGGRVWRQLNSRFFKYLRNACAVLVTCRREDVPLSGPAVSADSAEVFLEPAEASIEEADSIVPEAENPARRLSLKSNAVGWGLAIANVAVEIDMARHWSFSLPVYYSAWNYFKSTVKFRTFAVQPEVRYWLRDENEGAFAGAHFGMAYYNIATNGAYRYQDHDKRSPALGGGLSVGYRMPIGGDGRWKLELSVGAGIYRLHYDKFHNTPRTKDGLLVNSVKKTYAGIDRVAVSVAYSFDLKRKGGRL